MFWKPLRCVSLRGGKGNNLREGGNKFFFFEGGGLMSKVGFYFSCMKGGEKLYKGFI